MEILVILLSEYHSLIAKKNSNSIDIVNDLKKYTCSKKWPQL